VEIIDRCLTALLNEITDEGVGAFQRPETLSLEELPQFPHNLAHAGRLFTSLLLAGTAFLVLDPAAAGAEIVSADFHIPSG